MICILLKSITENPILCSENRIRLRSLHAPSRDVDTIAGRPLTSWSNTNYNLTKKSIPESKPSDILTIKDFSQIPHHFSLLPADRETEINCSSPASCSITNRYSDHALLMKVEPLTSSHLDHAWSDQAVGSFLCELLAQTRKITKSQRDEPPSCFLKKTLWYSSTEPSVELENEQS